MKVWKKINENEFPEGGNFPFSQNNEKALNLHKCCVIVCKEKDEIFRWCYYIVGVKVKVLSRIEETGEKWMKGRNFPFTRIKKKL